MAKSCYIHIPFCKNICSYCDFCKQFYDSKNVDVYLLKLQEEIKRDYQGEELDTLYIGGGTPTCFSLEELKKLFQIVSIFQKSKTMEFTVEANVETLTREKLEFMKQMGVNRLSIGMESVQPHIMKFLEREHTKEAIIETIQLARDCGFSNINVDLIYAVPNESIQDLEKDLEFITSLSVEHISTYSLMVEDHTKIGIQNIQPVSDELDKKMYDKIIETLTKQGYVHYEISNFARDGYFSNHNLCYWHNEEYYGFGLGASSYLLGVRSCNTRSLLHYPNVKIEEEILTEEDKQEYEVLLRLRLKEGIPLSHFQEIYQKRLEELFDYRGLVEEGFLREENGFLTIPEELWYVSNEILVKVLQNKKELC